MHGELLNDSARFIASLKKKTVNRTLFSCTNGLTNTPKKTAKDFGLFENVDTTALEHYNTLIQLSF